jgi:hypothetical protein
LRRHPGETSLWPEDSAWCRSRSESGSRGVTVVKDAVVKDAVVKDAVVEDARPTE